MAKKTAKKKAAKKKVAKKKACAVKESLVVGSKVKAFIKSKGCMTSADALSALNCKVYGLLEDAIVRTQGNKRSTVKPQDL